jgi:hypothetical protein
MSNLRVRGIEGQEVIPAFASGVDAHVDCIAPISVSITAIGVIPVIVFAEGIVNTILTVLVILVAIIVSPKKRVVKLAVKELDLE